MEYYSVIKKNQNVICSNMDRPRDHYQFKKKIETNDVEVHPFLGGTFFNFS